MNMNEALKHCASLCHAANKAYCETLGDFSQKPWSDTDQELQNSAIDGIHYQLHHNFPGSAKSHDNWVCFKLNAGWKYGAVKDPVKKTHPCLVEYDRLPKEQQAKNLIFTSICEQYFKPNINYKGINENKTN